MSSALSINGKLFVFTGWALCAYEFMSDSEKEMPKDDLLIKIMQNSKTLRKQDFLKDAIISFSGYIHKYEQDLINNSYIPEITYDYIIEFANSDKMQCDLDIIEYLIDEIQKLLIFMGVKKTIEIIDKKNIDNISYEDYISHIENKQLELILLTTLI